MSRDLPNQTVANAFVIWRVPANMAIDRETLLSNIDQDIEDAEEQCGFKFSKFSRRATPERTIKFLLGRNLLTHKDGFISRNKRTERYMARLPERVTQLLDSLPVCDPLILLAGTREEDK